MKFHKINEMIDIIISDEYSKIYKTYHPMKNYNLMIILQKWHLRHFLHKKWHQCHFFFCLAQSSD